MWKVFEISFFIVLSLNLVKCQCPTFVTRATWGARPANGAIPVLTVRPAPYLVIHQTGPVNQFCTNQNACQAQVRNIQANHLDERGFPDVAFSFIVGEDSLTYTGRGWFTQGENLGQFANQAVNIAYIGNFDGRQPSLSSRNLLDSIIQCGITAGHLRSNVRLVASCQIQGNFCGENSIHAWIRGHPRYEENPIPF